MNKKWVVATCSTLLTLISSPAVLAETVLEKVNRTGTLTLGTASLNLIPYVYVDGDDNIVGYSMDVAERIRAELETRLGQDVTLDVVGFETEADQIRAVETRDIDLSCTTRFTWERDQFVDFSVSYSLSGIRLLTSRSSNLGSPESLVGKRIGVFPNSLGEQAMALVQPNAIAVSFGSLDSALDALESGEVDAVAGDSVLLAGAMLPRDPEDQYGLYPPDPYARYGISCMVPEDNSGFLDVVNYSLVKLMEGYVSQEPQSVEMINRWFGPEGLVPMSSTLINSFFETIIQTREQIPLGRN